MPNPYLIAAGGQFLSGLFGSNSAKRQQDSSQKFQWEQFIRERDERYYFAGKDREQRGLDRGQQRYFFDERAGEREGIRGRQIGQAKQFRGMFGKDVLSQADQERLVQNQQLAQRGSYGNAASKIARTLGLNSPAGLRSLGQFQLNNEAQSRQRYGELAQNQKFSRDQSLLGYISNLYGGL